MKITAPLKRFICGAVDCGRLMVGVPSYEAYLNHLRTHHPDAAPMTNAQFVRDRQAARFGENSRGGFRCC